VAQRVDGGVAELGGDGEEVVHAGCLVVLAALDVAADERRDREVLFGEPAAVGWVGMVAVDHRPCSRRSASRQHGPAAGIASQVDACCK
jgi:hypothetical protein